MVFGGEGVGKTKGALDIARRLTSGEKMHVVDCDNAWAMKMPRELLEVNGGPVVLSEARGWQAQSDALAKVLRNAGWDDWVVLDKSSTPWDSILQWYIEHVHGEGLPEFLIQHRVEQVRTQKKATQGQDAVLVEWNFLNPLWHSVVTEPLTWAKCHVYVTAESAPIRSDGKDSAAVRDMYGHLGFKPRTQKGLGFAMHTVLYMQKSRRGDFRVTTVKDRERYELDREPWEDFFGTYLRTVAGWRAGKAVARGA